MGPQGPRDRRSQATEHKWDEDAAGLQGEASVESARKKAARKKTVARKKAVRKKTAARKKVTKKKAVTRKVTRKKTARSRVIANKATPKKTRTRRT
jgi:hypothetical protein